ncbi:YjcZ family sporulation protein (plasmid) [Bacillus thuringiensis]|uniref:YjcZ family sporulation protein n=1 Tax=Bacillus thuringiensis TaxID=1428 RepID=A0A9W3YKH7_BACTU|nr:YjcZ family sporulation protein [Bacillus thuringiensis]PNK24444.1 hypothetical protein CBR55_32420 [Bacillus thuringiensis]
MLVVLFILLIIVGAACFF